MSWSLENPLLPTEALSGDRAGNLAIVGTSSVEAPFMAVDFALNLNNSGQVVEEQTQSEEVLYVGVIYQLNLGQLVNRVRLVIPNSCSLVDGLADALPGRYWVNGRVMYVYAEGNGVFDPTLRVQATLPLFFEKELQVNLGDFENLTLESIYIGGRTFDAGDVTITGDIATIDFPTANVAECVITALIKPTPTRLVAIESFHSDVDADVLDLITYHGHTYLPSGDRYHPQPYTIIWNKPAQIFSLLT